eukprot:COSAG01_NODE_3467_length_6056_cov_2.509820_5_plen_88_part_00
MKAPSRRPAPDHGCISDDADAATGTAAGVLVVGLEIDRDAVRLHLGKLDGPQLDSDAHRLEGVAREGGHTRAFAATPRRLPSIDTLW